MPTTFNLKVGDVVSLKNGTHQTIQRINNYEEAEGDSCFYKWEINGQIAHAAMNPDQHEIVFVDNEQPPTEKDPKEELYKFLKVFPK